MTGTVLAPDLMGKRFIVHEVIGEVVSLPGNVRDTMYCVIINDPSCGEHEEMYDLPGRDLIFDRHEPT